MLSRESILPDLSRLRLVAPPVAATGVPGEDAASSAGSKRRRSDESDEDDDDDDAPIETSEVTRSVRKVVKAAGDLAQQLTSGSESSDRVNEESDPGDDNDSEGEDDSPKVRRAAAAVIKRAEALRDYGATVADVEELRARVSQGVSYGYLSEQRAAELYELLDRASATLETAMRSSSRESYGGPVAFLQAQSNDAASYAAAQREPSELADDLDGLSDFEDDDDDTSVLNMGEDYDEEAAEETASLLQQLVIDSGAGTRPQHLKNMRDEAVVLLRGVQSDGRVSEELKARARDLKRRIKPFRDASGGARTILSALESLLAAPVAVPVAAPEQGQEEAPAPTPPREPTIVGRATKVPVLGGAQQQRFLLFYPERQRYRWLSAADMTASEQLAAVFAAYTGDKDADPKENGWVVAVLASRGLSGARREYKVRWTVDQQVPVRHAEEWALRTQLVQGAQAMADKFDRGDDDEVSEASDDGDEGGAEGAVGRRSPALQWDPAAGRPKVSLRRAIAAHARDHGWAVQVLLEWTLTRMCALQSRAPPAPGEPGAPTAAELLQVGKDLFTIEEKAFTAAFKRERLQAARDRAVDGEAAEEDDDDDDDDGEEDEEEEEEEDEEAVFAAWRTERETELRDDAMERWAQTRRGDAGDAALLRRQLAALKVVKAAGGNPTDVYENEIEDDEVQALIRAWQAAVPSWHAQLSRPRLKLPKIRDFLMPNRSASARGFLALQRKLHSESDEPARRNGVMGSAYGTSWPRQATATWTPPDHVVPVRWFEGGTRLVIEAGDPAQTPAVVMSTLSQNSAKSDDALALFSAAGELGRAGQGVYYPRGVSKPKQAMLAKTVVWVWSLYPLISNKRRSIAIGAYAQSTGCATYGRAWENGPFKQLARAKSTAFERRIALLTLAIPRWGVGNPLVFNPSLLNEDIEELVLTRFKGTDAIPKLIDHVLQTSVADAPR